MKLFIIFFLVLTQVGVLFGKESPSLNSNIQGRWYCRFIQDEKKKTARGYAEYLVAFEINPSEILNYLYRDTRGKVSVLKVKTVQEGVLENSKITKITFFHKGGYWLIKDCIYEDKRALIIWFYNVKEEATYTIVVVQGLAI